MNLYEPYFESPRDGALLHLTLSYKDRVFDTIVARLLPLMILIVLFLVYVVKDVSGFQWLIGGILFVFLSILIILRVKKGIEISFMGQSIEMSTRKVYGIKKEIVSLKDADYIDDEIYKSPRVSGSYYRLVFKNKKSILLLRISGFSEYNEERFDQLNKKLEEITGLKVRSDWKAPLS